MSNSELNQLVSEVATCLGEGYRTQEDGDGDRIMTPLGVALVFHLDWKNKKKLKVYPSWGKLYNYLPYAVIRSDTGVGLSIARGAATIAKEIERRLLPDVEVHLQQAIENKTRLLENAQKTLELAKQICDFTDGRFTLPIDVSETDTQIVLRSRALSRDVASGRITVSYHESNEATSVTFDVETTHWLMINRIARALGELPQGNED